MSTGLAISKVMLMTTILLIAYGDDFGTSTDIVKLDFGEPGVNVQEGFLKLGLPDGGAGTFNSTFEYSGQKMAIRVTGFTHTRGDYKPVMNFYAGLSNLLRSSFLRNSPGVINVEISGLVPLSVYSIKTYHHSTSYAREGVSFSLQYEGNLKIKLRQSGNGKNPDPPLTHTEMVQTSIYGVVRLVMESEDSIGSVPNAHMDLNGMEIKPIGRVTDYLKLDFGEPGVNEQEGFLKIGRPDGPGGVTHYSQFDWSGRTVAIRITGWTYIRGNLKPVTNAYAGLSNLLRSSFLRSSPGEMFVKISGLKRVAMYLIKTYHHSTTYPRGGRSFSLQYEGNDKILLKQSGNGQSPDPPLVHSEVVQSSGEGIVRLVMNSDDGGGGKQQSDAHMDLNGMAIKYIGRSSTEGVKFDFGEPGVNVQKEFGFVKLGLPDGDSGTFVSAFEHFGQIATISITGYTHTRGNFPAVVNAYSTISNVLRSSFLRMTPGSMRVEIFGLRPWAMYEMKTFHHDTKYPNGGTIFYIEYEGDAKFLRKQSSKAINPDPPCIHTMNVRSNRYGIIRMVMNSATVPYKIPSDARLNLNAMNIMYLGEDKIKLDFGEPGVNVQKGFLKVGLPDSESGIFDSTFEWLGRTIEIKITGWTHARGNYETVTNQYAGLSNLLRSGFLRNSPGVMEVEVSGMKPGWKYLVTTYHHSTSYPLTGKYFTIQWEGSTKALMRQSGDGRTPNKILVKSDVVQSSSDGVIRLVMESNEDFPSVPDNAQMNLNGMEIKYTVLGRDTGKLDFGEPGINVQEGYLKLGLPSGRNTDNRTYSKTFEFFGQIARFKISGYTFVRGNFDEVTGTFSHLSNLLRSSFIRHQAGIMKVEISGLEPLTMYTVKTYHHSSYNPQGGARFTLQYEGNSPLKLGQSGNGVTPAMITMPVVQVLSSADGIIRLEMNREPQTPENVNMNLNGMEIYLSE